MVGIHARNKQLAVPFDHLRNSQAFHNIDANAEDGHGS
jgi:hypothetical protein